jgi:hypothetical protein
LGNVTARNTIVIRFLNFLENPVRNRELQVAYFHNIYNVGKKMSRGTEKKTKKA